MHFSLNAVRTVALIAVAGAALTFAEPARADFVNIVGVPLLNKMIDCNMMPGGM